MPLSIFLLIQSFETGGAQRQLIELAAGLHERGQMVSVGVFYNRGGLAGELERRGVTVIDLRKRDRWDLVPFMTRARRAIRETCPDVIYSFLGGANIVAAALRPVLPRTKLVWSIRASNMDPAQYSALLRLGIAIERRLSSTPDLIISNSHAGRDFALAHGFPEDRIAVVPNGIDTERFRPDPGTRARQRKAWGIRDDEVAVGVLARLDPMKGHGDLLHAAALLAEHPNLRFLCIGDGPEERRLKGLAADLGLTGRVSFTGATSDPVAALNGLDICCLPSLFGEGFSNAIAEAMACGVPCVVSDVGDSALLVGGTGEVVPRSDPRALAAAILDLAQDLSGDRSASARARIAQNFSVDSMIERTLQLLNGVARAQ